MYSSEVSVKLWKTKARFNVKKVKFDENILARRSECKAGRLSIV